MKISDFLSEDDVLIDLAVQGKSGLLRELAERAAQKLGLTRDAILTGLLARETLGSTGIGGGIAIPHARLDGIARPIAFFSRLHRPVDFEAIDNKPIDLAVLLLLPRLDNEKSLAALALVSRRLRNRKDVARLRDARTSRDLFAILVAEEPT